MMVLTNDIALARSQKVFVVAETVKGTLVFPVANDAVFPTNSVDLQQQPGYSDSEEVMDTCSLIDEFRDATSAGSWSIDVYARPTGAGLLPVEKALMEAVCGSKTVSAGSSVIYSLSKEKTALSIWQIKGHSMFFAAGATVNQLQLSLAKKGGLKLSFSGGFMRRGWAGTSELTSAADVDATTLQVADAKKLYTVDARVSVGSDTNGTSGYTITAVADTSITISPALATASAIGVVVAPYLPTPVLSGTPIEARTGYSVINGVNVPVTAMSYTHDNAITYLEDEITQDEYPTDYSADKRNISGKMSLYFRRADLAYFANGYSGENLPLIINTGSTTGQRLQITMPRTRFAVPSLSGDKEVVLDIDFKAKGTTGEDEVSFKYY